MFLNSRIKKKSFQHKDHRDKSHVMSTSAQQFYLMTELSLEKDCITALNSQDIGTQTSPNTGRGQKH